MRAAHNGPPGPHRLFSPRCTRALATEASKRSLAGQSREEICAVLADDSARAFDLLEPPLGSYGIRADSG